MLVFQAAPELFIIPSKTITQDSKIPPQPVDDKQTTLQEMGDKSPLLLTEETEKERTRQEKKENTGDKSPLLVTEETEKERARREKKEKKRKKKEKRESKRKERAERKEKEEQAGFALEKVSAKHEEKLNNINSPEHSPSKAEPKVKFTFEDIVSKAQTTRESVDVLRKSSLQKPFIPLQRTETLDSMEEESMRSFPPAITPSKHSWSPRTSMGPKGLNLELDSSEEENAPIRSPSYRSSSKDPGSDSSASDHKRRPKLRRQLSQKRQKRRQVYSESD